ncbi:MAG: DUF4406 domain-containing protein [Treponema sp.]|nr:DUF4406 domain-containing protein [Treponema sp.]
MIVYVSGQISGMENRNRFAFNDAVLSVKNELGKMCEVINPIAIGERIDKMFEELSTETGEEKTPDWHDYMRDCIRELTHVTHILMLNGWEKSKGATVEKELAEKLGIKVCYSVDDLKQSYKNAAQTGEW